MLILARNVGQEIVITHPEGEIVVLVMANEREGRVKLGVQAPPSVAVHRREVVRRRAAMR